MARKDRLGQEPRRIMSGDVLKVLGAIMTVQASLGRLLAFQTVPDLGALGQAEALVQAQSLLEGGSGTMVAVAYVLQMAANFAWPVFAFLAVQGFLYTSNLKFYLLRLSIFALVSEIPYDLVTSGLWFNWGDQNVLFTILFGLLALTLSEELSRRSNSYFPRFAMLIGGVLWVTLLKMEYNFFIIPAMFAFFYLEERELLRDLLVLLLTALMIPSMGLYTLAVTGPTAVALLALHWYNDVTPRISKWVWYGLYPLHLILLAVLGAYM